MAIFQVATNTPPKSEIIADWIVDQSWGPDNASSLEVVGSYHLQDPEGEVGMQGQLVAVGGVVFHVPLTYRSTSVPEMEDAFMATMEHSVLGTRYVYDAMSDSRFVSVLAGVAACGYGQSLGFAKVDGLWQAWPESAKLHGHGRVSGRIVVDEFGPVETSRDQVVLRNSGLELTVYRRPADGPAPDIGLTATWPNSGAAVVLVSVLRTSAEDVG